MLAGIWRDRWTKAEVDAWLESHGLGGQLRAESLDVEEFLTLANALKERWGGESTEVVGEESED